MIWGHNTSKKEATSTNLIPPSPVSSSASSSTSSLASSFASILTIPSTPSQQHPSSHQQEHQPHQQQHVQFQPHQKHHHHHRDSHHPHVKLEGFLNPKELIESALTIMLTIPSPYSIETLRDFIVPKFYHAAYVRASLSGIQRRSK